MPEVYKNLPEELPPALAEAMTQAKAGKISPVQFLQLFEEHGVGGIQRLIYAHRAFNLPFEELKRIDTERGRGLTDRQSEEIIDTLEQLKP